MQLELELKYPKSDLRLRKNGEKIEVMDLIRKKWLQLSPEEYVRQHLLNYLVNTKNYPASRISTEKEIDLNGTRKRFDIVVFDKDKTPFILIECKAPYIDLTGETLEQALRYNLVLKAHYVMLSNGVSDFILHGESRPPELPNYSE